MHKGNAPAQDSHIERFRTSSGDTAHLCDGVHPTSSFSIGTARGVVGSAVEVDAAGSGAGFALGAVLRAAPRTNDGTFRVCLANRSMSC